VAERTPGIYVRLDANYDTDEAMLEVSPLAELIFIRALAYSKRKQTDGVVPRRALNRIGLRLDVDLDDLAAQLVAAELWSTTESGWEITGWSKWQFTKQEVDAASERNRQRAFQRHHREGRHDHEPHPECPSCAGGMPLAPESVPKTVPQDDATKRNTTGAAGTCGKPGHDGCTRCDGTGWVNVHDNNGRVIEVATCLGPLRAVEAS
jgi:hypothetical protein